MPKNPLVIFLFELLNARYECSKAPQHKRAGLRQQQKRRFNPIFKSLENAERSAYRSLKSSDDNLEQWHKYKKPWLHCHPDDQLLFDMIEQERFVFKNESSRFDPEIVSLIMLHRFQSMSKQSREKNDLPSCTGSDRPMSYQGRLCVVPEAAYVHFPKWFKALRNEFLRGTKYSVTWYPP